MVKAAYERLKGRYVRFRVRDIHLPEPTAVLHELHDGDVLEGRVVDLSDDGRGKEGAAFLVVEVAGLRKPCILSAERILTRTRRAR
jgi:hypothetical protein